ncbi:MAG: hypothetical protein ACJ8J0_12595 [Longimicrobiaceae bacterium]
MSDADPHPAPGAPSPGEGAPAPAAAPRHRWAAGTPRLLLEAALIVLSVLLGFAANEWQQTRSERALAQNVLDNFRRELQANLATVQRIYPRHRAFTERLGEAAASAHGDSTAFEVFAARMPADGLELAPLQEAAWETASSTGALRLLDYPTAALLSETYLIQRASTARTIERISDRFLSPGNFDPAAQRTMLRSQHMLFVELSGQESYLVEVYRKALARLPRQTSR